MRVRAVSERSSLTVGVGIALTANATPTVRAKTDQIVSGIVTCSRFGNHIRREKVGARIAPSPVPDEQE